MSLRLQVSLNGARGAAEGAAVPLSPGDLAESALGAVAAGAVEVLVHPRTPCGRESLSPRVVGPLLEALRGAGVSVPLSVCAGIAAEPDPGGRLERVRSWRVLPDRAAVHFAEPGAAELARVLLARGVAVDAVVTLSGVPEEGAMAATGCAAGAAGFGALARFLASRAPEPAGRARVRPAAELAVVPAAADPAVVAGLVAALRRPAVGSLLLYGREAAAWPVLRLAVRCGADARIGLGDVLRLPDGRPAGSNAALVAAAHEVAGAGTGTAGGGAFRW
ncbi:3-keto-5-aminohexanoate cleavage protein [Streptomyces sp. NPDC004050]